MGTGDEMDLQEQRARLEQALRGQVSDSRIAAAFGAVPRELFVLPEYQGAAYYDQPLPIGHGQTISQPLMVAIMLDVLAPKPADVVLDIGTGSGYQAALLSVLTARVVGVERIPELVEMARRALVTGGYGNVEVHLAGEELGWPAGAPYDGIVVAAGAPEVSLDLVGQLAIGGRLVIPVGTLYDQDLACVTKTPEGVKTTWHGPCRFVPLVSSRAWPEDAMSDRLRDPWL